MASPNRSRHVTRWLTLLPLLLAAVSLACALPGIFGPKPTPAAVLPAATATLPPPPLPPTLLESDPPSGSVIALSAPIKLVFNQAMNRASVEAAASMGGASGRFEWQDDAVVSFIPDAALLPETALTIRISVTAQSGQGMPLNKPVELQFRAASSLRLTQALPEDGQSEVNPTSAVVAAFNQPVVALGADPSSLPAAFSLEPSASGRGEWINTSTYIFYPEPPLVGGLTYTVRLAQDLVSTLGAPLQNPDASWSFSVALPQVSGYEPQDTILLPLDSPVRLHFNQPMNSDSVAANFRLQAKDQPPVAGQTAWDDTFTSLVFTPTVLLQRGAAYEVVLDGNAQSAGGALLGQAFQASFSTVGEFVQESSIPAYNGVTETWEGVWVQFSSQLPARGYEPYFRFEPQVDNLNSVLDGNNSAVRFYGDFQPNTSYILFIDAGLQDRWGGRLKNPLSLPFRTAPLSPRLEAPGSPGVMFLTPADNGISVQLTNLPRLPLSMGSVPLQDFISLVGPDGYGLRQSFQPVDSQAWKADFNLSPDHTSMVQLPLTPDGGGLQPGIYLLRADIDRDLAYANDFVLVVSNVHLTYKISATDVLVWAVDTRSNQPVAGAPLAVYLDDGTQLVSGVTGNDGVFRSSFTGQVSPYQTSLVVMGQPGEELFSAAVSAWNAGLEPYIFDISSTSAGPGPKTYLYTDRPIYRPGQTVYFRAVARLENNGRYSLPGDMPTVSVAVYDNEGARLASYDLGLSAFGSAHSEFQLQPDASPGYYRLESGEASIYFQVAEYRKPEINLQVSFDKLQALAGESLAATINARYFFDAPAGNVSFTWTLFEAPATFSIPGYQSGLMDEGWLQVFDYGQFFPGIGSPVANGSAVTGPDGILTLEMPIPQTSTTLGSGTRTYTLEVTAADESGLPVSARASALVHPTSFYIGVQPDVWAGQAGLESGYNVQVVDWDKNPAGSHQLNASFRKVVYLRQDPPPGKPEEFPTWIPQYTDISSVDFATGPDGQARLAFTPPQPGTYLLEVSGDGALTQVMVWVGGSGQAVWPNLPNQRLRLTPDQEAYQPGQTAHVFVPNPFPQAAQALVTVERGVVMRHAVHSLPPGGDTLDIPLGDEDAPNVYLAVSLLGQDEQGRADFRQGYVRLDVTPRQQTLNVELTRTPERLGPRDKVTFSLRVTDAAGLPVQGEFSLAVVDLAALALADPNSVDILPAFYGQQPLGVRTYLSLAGYANRQLFIVGGLGGGGGGETAAVVRSEFPDTAYWNGAIVTDANGQASISLTLPDNLTTWQVDVRGLTADTRVGQALTQVVATKEVLVRPVTPRFLVAGDHALLAAVVQNNTASDLPAEVSLQASGFAIDDGQDAVRPVTLPAGGRVRVEWWGTALDAASADLTFSVQAGEYQDAARPALGALPVLRYTARQAFATAGYLEGAVQQLELVSLPPGAQVSTAPGAADQLRVELSPSLAAAMLTSLDALEYYPYECTEQTLARFLPNLLLQQALQKFNINLPDVQTRLERTLQPGLEKLAARQNDDGGWGWWTGEQSSPYITAYVLFGLAQARQAGAAISEDSLHRAVDYLNASRLSPDGSMLAYELDRLAFTHFALAQAGAPDLSHAQALLAYRDQLSPWAQALLALALEAGSPGSPEAADLLAVLQSTVQRSATGVFWADSSPRSQNLNTTLTTSAMVVYALASRDPASSLLPDALRFIMAGRGAQGGWASTFETTWALLAATTYMQGTGELSGDYSFQATLNGAPLASGQAGGDTRLTSVSASAPATSLYPANPNALRIERSAGTGRLYYRAILDVSFPAEQAAAVNRGLVVERAYYLAGHGQPVQAAPADSRMTVRLTLVVPSDAYYVVVEDYIPAGSEILDTSLKTSQLGEPALVEAPPEPLYDPGNPFAQGWGWWLFQQPQIYDDHIAWAASYLPAGTYQLTYTLTLLQAGEYRLLPARAYQFYFPDVQGSSAGAVFTIQTRP